MGSKIQKYFTTRFFQVENNTKLFQSVQKDLKVLGFIRNHAGYRYYPLSMRHLRATTTYLVAVVSVSAYVVHSGHSPDEYMVAFFLLASTFTFFVSHMSITFNLRKIFDFFDSCDHVYDGEFDYCFSIFKFTLFIQLIETTIINSKTIKLRVSWTKRNDW